MVANNELPGRIFLFCKDRGLAVNTDSFFGICHSFVFPYQWILHSLSQYARKQKAEMETIFPAAVLADLPPYLAALALTAGISFFCHVTWNDPTWDPERIIRTATLSQNYPPDNGQFLSNPSLWTIPLEIEFYLLYPLAFSLFSRLRSSLLALLA